MTDSASVEGIAETVTCGLVVVEANEAAVVVIVGVVEEAGVGL